MYVNILEAVKLLEIKYEEQLQNDPPLQFVLNFYRDNILVIDRFTNIELLPISEFGQLTEIPDEIRILNCWKCLLKLHPILVTPNEREQFYQPAIVATACIIFRELAVKLERKNQIKQQIQLLCLQLESKVDNNYHVQCLKTLLTVFDDPWQYNPIISDILYDVVDDYEKFVDFFAFEGGALLALRYHFLQQHVKDPRLSLNFAKHALNVFNYFSGPDDERTKLLSYMEDYTYFEMYQECMRDRIATENENERTGIDSLPNSMPAVDMITQMTPRCALVIHSHSVESLKSDKQSPLDSEIFCIFLKLQIKNIVELCLDGLTDTEGAYEHNFKTFLESHLVLFPDTNCTDDKLGICEDIDEFIDQTDILNWTCFVLRKLKCKDLAEIHQKLAMKLVFNELQHLENLRADEKTSKRELIYAHRDISIAVYNLRFVFNWFHKEILLVAFHYYPKESMYEEFCELARIKMDICIHDDLSKLPIDKYVLKDLCNILTLRKIPDFDWSLPWSKMEKKIKLIIKNKAETFDRCMHNSKIQERNLKYINLDYQLYEDLPEGPGYTVEPNYVHYLTEEQRPQFFYTAEEEEQLKINDPHTYYNLLMGNCPAAKKKANQKHPTKKSPIKRRKSLYHEERIQNRFSKNKRSKNTKSKKTKSKTTKSKTTKPKSPKSKTPKSKTPKTENTKSKNTKTKQKPENENFKKTSTARTCKEKVSESLQNGNSVAAETKTSKSFSSPKLQQLQKDFEMLKSKNQSKYSPARAVKPEIFPNKSPTILMRVESFGQTSPKVSPKIKPRKCLSQPTTSTRPKPEPVLTGIAPRNRKRKTDR